MTTAERAAAPLLPDLPRAGRMVSSPTGSGSAPSSRTVAGPTSSPSDRCCLHDRWKDLLLSDAHRSRRPHPPGSRRPDPRADLRNGSRGLQSLRAGNQNSFQCGVLDGQRERESGELGAPLLEIARMPGAGRKVIKGPAGCPDRARARSDSAARWQRRSAVPRPSRTDSRYSPAGRHRTECTESDAAIVLRRESVGIEAVRSGHSFGRRWTTKGIRTPVSLWGSGIRQPRRRRGPGGRSPRRG